jgi:uncharacterized protein (DUF924 family)
MTVRPAEVLDFWFGSAGQVDKRWFNGGAAFDVAIRQAHGRTLAAALAGALDGWVDEGASSTLALILVLDQFTRNVHRGTPQAFAGDALALALAKGLVARGGDLGLTLLQRWFAAMPFEHAEDAAVQETSLRLFERLLADAAGSPHQETLASALDYARRHAEVISRFGRFPHRNDILGRESTAEELLFLQQPGSRF